jgi:hypothetical protein
MFFKECATGLFSSRCGTLIFEYVQSIGNKRFADARGIPILGIDDTEGLLWVEFWVRATGAAGAELFFSVLAAGWRDFIAR